MSRYKISSAYSQLSIAHIMSRIIFMKYLPSVRLKLIPKIKNAQNLLKFGTFDISNVLISILVPKMTFIKYLPPITG